MKRFYNLLSLFLLSMVGITSAVAQGYVRGSLLTSMDEVVTQQVYVYAPHTYSDGTAGYMCGVGAISATATDDCLYQFEEVSGKTADGYKVYRLKQVSTGLYLKDYDLGNTDTEDSEDMAMTENAEEAFEFTSLPFVEGSDNVRENAMGATAETQKQDLTNPGFVFTRAVLPDTDEGVQYIGHLSSPFWSPYVDTNAWLIYSVTAIYGEDKLRSYIAAIYNGTAPSETYPAGTEPGSYDAALVQAAQDVYDEAQAAIGGDSFTLTNEEVDDLVARMKSTMEALADPSAFHSIEAGYYFINSKAGRFLYSNTSGGQEFLWATGENSYSVPETLTPSDVVYTWKITPVEGETELFLVQNVLTGSYINGQQANLSSMDDGKGFILGQEGQIILRKGGQNGAFLIVAKDKSGATQFHAKFTGGVMAWNADAANNNNFVFTPVAEEDVLAQVEQAKQDVLNNQLRALYEEAEATYNSGRNYDSPGRLGEAFDAENALVDPTGDEASSNWFSNYKDSEEGAYENLFDGDYTTFFHSDWHGGNFTPDLNGKYHFLAAELNTPVTNGVQIKMSKRYNSGNNTAIDYPTQVVIFGSNDADKANPESGTWDKLGETTVLWNTAATVNGSSVKNMIGFANVLFDGSYQYIKMAVVGTDLGRGYFALGEANMWQIIGTEMVESDAMQQVPADVKNELLNQIAAAKAAVEGNAATNELIASLQAAYDNYMSQYPEPERVTTIVNEAKAFLENAQNNNLIGTALALYSQEKADALQAAITKGEAFTGITLEEINAMVNEITNALNEFKGSIILPSEGKFYLLRSASRKVAASTEGIAGLNSYNAIVYSPNNSMEGTNEVLKYTRPQGAAEFVVGDDFGSLSDTLSYDSDLRYLWKIENAANGKIVIRNVGTGMYMAADEGRVFQTNEPFEVALEGIAADTFLINAGKNSSGQTLYANAKGANLSVTTWSSATDANSSWWFDEVNSSMLDSYVNMVGVEMTAGQYRILTLPYAVDGTSGSGMAYNLVGVTEDNKMVLAEVDDIIPAATPFIYRSEGFDNGRCESFIMNDLALEGLGEGGEVDYVFEPVHVAGITGTICKNDTIGTGFGYFNNNNVSVTTAAENVIGTNSGYFDATHATGVSEADGDEVIDLGRGVIDSIEDSKVVVVPSIVNVYSLNGTLVRKNVKAATATQGLPAGLYIVGGAKVLVK